MYDPLGGRSVRCVQDLPHQQRLQSSPHHTRDGARLQVLHQVVTVGS